MARPKTRSAGLPAKVFLRPSGAGDLYYYQHKGKKVPLGSDRRRALRKAAQIARGATTLEDARISDAEKLTESDIAARAVTLRKEPGIYFLLRRGRIEYIGQSIDVFVRIRQHEKRKQFDAFCWIPCEIDKLAATEKYLIEKFRPPQNIAVFRTGSENSIASL